MIYIKNILQNERLNMIFKSKDFCLKKYGKSSNLPIFK